MDRNPNHKLIFKVASVICILGILLLIVNSAVYMNYAFRKVGYNDDFRFAMLHIKPWLDGEWNFNSLWGDVHPNPIHGVILILSTTIESMRFNILPYIIFPFIVLKWFLFTTAYRFAASLTLSQSIFAGFCFALVLFSMNSTDQYVWNSVGIIQIYHVLGAVYMLAFLKFLERQNKASITWLTILSLIFLLTARQFAIPWLIASAAVLLMRRMMRDKGEDRWSFYYFLVIVMGVLLIEKAFHIVFHVDIGYSTDIGALGKFLDDWAHRPLSLSKFLMVSVTSSLINIYHLRSIGFSENQIIGVCAVYSMVYFSAIIISIARISRLVYKLSLVMLLFPLVTIVPELIYRVDLETEWMQGYVARYVSFRDIGVLGIIVVALDIAYQSSAKIISIALTALLVVSIMACNITYAIYRWEHLPYVIKYHENLAYAVKFVGDYLETYPIDCSEETRQKHTRPKSPNN